MLKSLNISNFAVIERLEVEFGTGLNLLTGETGSGKSIIVDSLSLLMGGRSSAAQIRTGERLASIEGLFELQSANQGMVRAILDEAQIESLRGSEINIRREIADSGRSRILIDEQSATLATLKSLQPHLVQIHGQGEQRALLSAQSQMYLLDLYAGCLSLRAEVAEAYTRWKETLLALDRLQSERRERDRTHELLEFQLSEIKAIAPIAFEDEELWAERRVLTHAEKILELGASAYEQLYEKDGSIIEGLGHVRKSLEELSRIDTRILSVLETLEAGITQISDVADTLRGYGEGVAFSPGRLAAVEQRLAELDRLKRKYGKSLEEILKIEDEISERLESLDSLGERELHLREQLIVARRDYVQLAEKLTAKRSEAAVGLAARVMKDLRDVAMEQARFIVSLETAEETNQEKGLGVELAESGIASDNDPEEASSIKGRYFTPNGADRVEFLLSANPGESPRSLSKVASGGELSRLMLTLRAAVLDDKQSADAPEAIIFDEIDTGIGGRAAEAVGLRLKALSRARQVLCVTHQPQIARFADHHYLVEKGLEKGRTQTSIRHLDGEERVAELSRMIGGDQDTVKTLEAARWLLEEAGDKTRRGGPGAFRRVKRSKSA